MVPALIVKNGYRLRDFVGLPIGGKRVTIRMKVQRYKCKGCDFDRQENIPFATGSRSYTHRFAKHVADLLRGMTLQDVSNYPGVSWIRRKVYSMGKDTNKRKVLKGTRCLPLGNGADIFDKRHRTRLENALAMNEPLSKAYYLKEQLRQIWSQPMKAMAEEVLDDWIRQAEQSKIAQLQKMAVAMRACKKGYPQTTMEAKGEYES